MTNEKSETVEILPEKDNLFDKIASSLLKKRSTGGQFLVQFAMFIIFVVFYFVVKGTGMFVINLLLNIIGSAEAYKYKEYLTTAIVLVVGFYVFFKMQKAINKAKKRLDSNKNKEELNIENKKRKKFLTYLILLIVLGAILGFVAGYFGLFTD